MLAILKFLPFLALVAFMSIEVSAETLALGATYSSLVKAGHFNGLSSVYTVKETGSEPINVQTGGCSEAQIPDSCNVDPVSWDNDAEISVQINTPTDLSVPAGMTPAKFKIALCYSPSDQVNRKWRKFDDLFKKDKTCIQTTDPYDYIPGEPITKGIKIKSVVPSVHLTLQTFVICSDADGQLQGKNKYCHLGNPPNKADATADPPVRSKTDNIYFKTIVMENRPTNLYVAVFICAALGPIMLISFLIYERGVLAKNA